MLRDDLQRTFGNRAVQRMFYHERAPLWNHHQILLYLLSRYPDIMAERVGSRSTRAKQFDLWARDSGNHDLGKWLTANGIRASADNVLEAAATALLNPILAPSEGMEVEETKEEEEEEEEQPDTIEEMTLDDFVAEAEKAPKDDTAYDPKSTETADVMQEETTRVGQAKRRSISSRRIKRQVEPEEAEEEEEEPSSRSRKKARSKPETDPDEQIIRKLEALKPRGKVPFLMVTWNLEKYGISTDTSVKNDKRRVVARILDTFHPSAFVMQEVTDAKLLFEGSKLMSLGILRTNLFAMDTGGETDPKEKNPLAYGETDLLQHYPVAREFHTLSGPLFHSFSGNYSEHYPLVYDSTQVVETPRCYYVDSVGKSYKLVPCDSKDTLHFSSRPVEGFPESKTRPLLVWELQMQTEGYALRFNAPPTTTKLTARQKQVRASLWRQRQKAMQSEALRKTRTIYLGVVHTSPSNEKGIEQETAELLKQGEWLKSKFGNQVILAGDWYMERQSPETFDAIARGEKWQMGAPPQRPEWDIPHAATEEKRESLKSEEAPNFMPTNLAKKEGHASQTADFFVLSKDFDVSFTSAISLNPEKLQAWHDLEYPKQKMDVEKDLFAPIDAVGADHVAVVTVFYA